MIQVTVLQAQTRLPELLSAAEAGEGVEIRADNGRTFRVSPNRTRPTKTGTPQAGRYKGLIEVPDDFDAPLEELKEYME